MTTKKQLRERIQGEIEINAAWDKTLDHWISRCNERDSEIRTLNQSLALYSDRLHDFQSRIEEKDVEIAELREACGDLQEKVSVRTRQLNRARINHALGLDDEPDDELYVSDEFRALVGEDGGPEIGIW